MQYSEYLALQQGEVPAEPFYAAVDALQAQSGYHTAAELAASRPPALTSFARTAGLSTVGDGGGRLYRRVPNMPSSAGRVQSADGAWWDPVPAGPVMEQIGALVTFSGEAVWDVTSFDPAKYFSYEIVLSNVTPSTNNAEFWLRLRAGSAIRSGATDYSWNQGAGVTTGSTLRLGIGVGSGAGQHGWSGRVTVYAPHRATKTVVTYQGAFFPAAGGFTPVQGGGCCNSAGANDGVRFAFTGGGFGAGQAAVWGMRAV